MLSAGDNVLMRMPDSADQPILHLGTVMDVSDNVYRTEFEVEDLGPTQGQDVLLYFQGEESFLQQPARIGVIERDNPISVLGIETRGDPVSAEKRMSERVSTVATELMAVLGDDGEDCPLLDISATGLALMSSVGHSVGTVVPVTLISGPEEFTGEARIQSAKELWEGRYRYGLCVLDGGSGTETLIGGLVTILERM